MALQSRLMCSILLVVITAGLAACGGAAATPAPMETTAPSPTEAPTMAAGPTAAPTAASTATPLPSDVASARDSMTLVINEEPLTMNPFPSQGGIAAAPGKDNMVDPLTWQSGDDQRIVPTTATESWEQLAPNKWRFQLRQGVKFHNGEAWNAQAALPSLAYQGVGNNDNSSFAYTGGFKAEAIDEYTLDITCDQACSIFPNSTIFLNFLAPEFYTSSSDETLSREVVGFGPYKLVEWQPGVELTQEAF